MRKMSKVVLLSCVFFFVVYVLICMLSSLWLRHIVVKCNTETLFDQSIAMYFSDKSLIQSLDYRCEARHLTTKPTFDIQVSLPFFAVGIGQSYARFYVTWNGYEEIRDEKIHRVGVRNQAVDVRLQWQNGKWVITDITKHEYLD